MGMTLREASKEAAKSVKLTKEEKTAIRNYNRRIETAAKHLEKTGKTTQASMVRAAKMTTGEYANLISKAKSGSEYSPRPRYKKRERVLSVMRGATFKNLTKTKKNRAGIEIPKWISNRYERMIYDFKEDANKASVALGREQARKKGMTISPLGEGYLDAGKITNLDIKNPDKIIRRIEMGKYHAGGNIKTQETITVNGKPQKIETEESIKEIIYKRNFMKAIEKQYLTYYNMQDKATASEVVTGLNKLKNIINSYTGAELARMIRENPALGNIEDMYKATDSQYFFRGKRKRGKGIGIQGFADVEQLSDMVMLWEYAQQQNPRG